MALPEAGLKITISSPSFTVVVRAYSSPRGSVASVGSVGAVVGSVGAAVGYGYTSAAAYRYAKKEGESGIMFTGILGTIMAIVFIVLLLVPIPMFNCSLGRESYICLLIWIVLGAVFYAGKKKRE